MDTKVEVAVDLLSRIKRQREELGNAGRSIIPAALRLGLSMDRIAEITGTTVAHVEHVGKGDGLIGAHQDD